ncbi:hypothetical protein CAPTEDRAFT_155647 [Capitella teleta]|uniref:Peptidase S1 domain-containing protein n=1 Tax=Capitella teleta TaxID=283909 RepID=R7VDK4_CAPTE|nr:hypothetical protein CAPTEDRAFT_155647 [Capitella teleta]|eukprot:ELU16689.1 hypothetical protein CAPTEDRAFT_155647 [Capitella teleta]
MLRERDDGWGHTCGATLINENWALSAAHCTDGASPAQRRIQAGVNLRDDPNGQMKEIAEIIEHPDYVVGGGYPNDVCVLRFTTPVTYNEKVQPGLLPEEGEEFAGDECYITGWGRTDTSQDIPNDLREGLIDVLTNQVCSSAVSNIGPYHICIRDPNSVYGACNGDSGGPIHCRASSSDPWKQVGVASWVMASGGNCMVAFPSVYGRVSYHKQWIDDSIN